MKNQTGRRARASGAMLAAAMLLGGCAGLHERDEGMRAAPEAARALFNERCKTAGEHIRSTAENVEGVFLAKVRPAETNHWDQFGMDDPYGRDFGGEEYIESFLAGSHEAKKEIFVRPAGSPPRVGYRLVEVKDADTGERMRYTGGMKTVAKKQVYLAVDSIGMPARSVREVNVYGYALDRQPARGEPLRYGVTYEDISTREDRANWIAGSSLKVIDMRTGEVMAERIGYMIDIEQGLRTGGRSPWLMAANHACPDFHRMVGPEMREPGTSPQIWQTLDFVSKVLKPAR